MTYSVYVEDSPEPLKGGETVNTFRGDEFIFKGCTHPRKVTVLDSKGRERDFYANVIYTGIRDDSDGNWTFYPSWNPIDSRCNCEHEDHFPPKGTKHAYQVNAKICLGHIDIGGICSECAQTCLSGYKQMPIRTL